MFLNILSREEKLNFIDLLVRVVRIDGEMTEHEKELIRLMKYELAEDLAKYHKGNASLDKLVDYFSQKPSMTKNLVYTNLFAITLQDEFYSVEDHFILEDIRQKFGISDRKKAELLKIVYAERDFKEKAKRVLTAE
jgi:hypothetical protein